MNIDPSTAILNNSSIVQTTQLKLQVCANEMSVVPYNAHDNSPEQCAGEFFCASTKYTFSSQFSRFWQYWNKQSACSSAWFCNWKPDNIDRRTQEQLTCTTTAESSEGDANHQTGKEWNLCRL